MQTQQTNGLRILIAASLLSVVLGSIHAFSVFIEPLEIRFGALRSSVSLSYSLALLALTFGVLLGPRLFHRCSAAQFFLLASTLAALGASLAATADSLAVIWLGYSLIFGLANGLGYGYGLQLAAQVNPGREGLSMGIVTAAYALGAVLSPALFNHALDHYGYALAMAGLAVVLVITGASSTAIAWTTGVGYQGAAQQAARMTDAPRTERLLWLGYFGGVLAGLMVIGHAAGIAASFGLDEHSWLAPVIIAICNLLGSLSGGRLVDQMSPGKLLKSLAIMTSVALFGLTVFGKSGGLMIGLGVVGFAYGGTIAAYPASIAKLFGMQKSASVYGRVFTAWGAAGLIGPWFAGFLYDWSENYQVALLTAALIGLMSVGAIHLLFAQARHVEGSTI